MTMTKTLLQPYPDTDDNTSSNQKVGGVSYLRLGNTGKRFSVVAESEVGSVKIFNQELDFTFVKRISEERKQEILDIKDVHKRSEIWNLELKNLLEATIAEATKKLKGDEEYSINTPAPSQDNDD